MPKHPSRKCYGSSISLRPEVVYHANRKVAGNSDEEA